MPTKEVHIDLGRIVFHNKGRAYRNLAVTMLVGARIEGLTETADAVTLTYRGPDAEDADTLTVDVVLQAIGFAPRTGGYGLEKLAWRPTPAPAASSSTTSWKPPCQACTLSATSPPS